MATPTPLTPEQLSALGLSLAPGMPGTYEFDPSAASALVPNLGMHLENAAQASGGSSGDSTNDTINKIGAGAAVGLAALAVGVPGPGTVVAGVGGAILAGVKLFQALGATKTSPVPADPPKCCSTNTCQADAWSYTQMVLRTMGPFSGQDWLTGWFGGTTTSGGVFGIGSGSKLVNVAGVLPHPRFGDETTMNAQFIKVRSSNIKTLLSNSSLPNFHDYYLQVFEPWWQSWCEGCEEPSHWTSTFSPALLLAEALTAWNNKWSNYDGETVYYTVDVKNGSLAPGEGQGNASATVQAILNSSGQELADADPVAYSLWFIAPDAPSGHTTAMQFRVRQPSAAGVKQHLADQQSIDTGVNATVENAERNGYVPAALGVVAAIGLALLLL
jgi:hypothetical protein